MKLVIVYDMSKVYFPLKKTCCKLINCCQYHISTTANAISLDSKTKQSNDKAHYENFPKEKKQTAK